MYTLLRFYIFSRYFCPWNKHTEDDGTSPPWPKSPNQVSGAQVHISEFLCIITSHDLSNLEFLILELKLPVPLLKRIRLRKWRVEAKSYLIAQLLSASEISPLICIVPLCYLCPLLKCSLKSLPNLVPRGKLEGSAGLSGHGKCISLPLFYNSSSLCTHKPNPNLLWTFPD